MDNYWIILGVIFIIIFTIIWYDVIIKHIVRAKRKKLRYKTEDIRVCATRVEFVPPKKATLLDWKSHPVKYNVYYVYGYRDNHFNNQKLYRKVTNGERTFDITVHSGYDVNGKLRYQYHTIKW